MGAWNIKDVSSADFREDLRAQKGKEKLSLLLGVCLYHNKCLFEGQWENKPKHFTASIKNSTLSRLNPEQRGSSFVCMDKGFGVEAVWEGGGWGVLSSGPHLRSGHWGASLQLLRFTFPLARGVTWQLRANALRGFLLSLDTDRLYHGPTLQRENIPSFHDITPPGMEGEEGAQLVATAVPSAAV